LNGAYKSFHPNGKLRISGEYKNGLYNGAWKYFDKFGRIVGEADFNMGTGVQTAFYPNGKKKRIVHYKNNKKHGREEQYKPNGELNNVIIYENGVLIEEKSK